MNGRRLAAISLALILLAAAALRLWALDGPALWWDEGNNAYFAHQSLARLLEMTRLTHDTDPPAHRLALGLWLRLLGDSAFNLRLLSAVLGVATVGLVFQWGHWLAGGRVGLLASLLTAFSPLAVYYSREAKGYPFVAFFGLLALYLWTRYLHEQERAHPMLWVAYVLAEVLALGAHYYALLLPIGQGVWLTALLFMDLPRRSLARRRLRRWLFAQAASIGLVLPWALLTLPTALAGARGVAMSGSSPMSLDGYLREVFLSFAGGATTHGWAAALALGVLAMAAIWGLWPCLSERSGLLASVFFVPLTLGFFAQRSFTFFSARFLLYIAPLLYLLAALGMVRLHKIGVALGVFLALAWAIALPLAYTPFKGPEEDLRPLAQALRERARPGDGILVGYIWEEGILRMYAPTVQARYYLDWPAAASWEEWMGKLLAEHPRLWLVTYGAPLQNEQGNPTGWWLEHHAVRASVTENGPNRLVLYLPRPAEASPQEKVAFEQGINLLYTSLSERAPLGEPLLVTLHWEVTTPVSQSYGVFVHLVDEEGERIWAQHDGDPANSLKPFNTLEPGQLIADCHVLWMPANMPPGRYKLLVGLYRRDTGERLEVVRGPARGANRCVVGEVRVPSE